MDKQISYDVAVADYSETRECGTVEGDWIKGTVAPMEVRVPVELYRVHHKPYNFRLDDDGKTTFWKGVFPESYEHETESGKEWAVFKLDWAKATTAS